MLTVVGFQVPVIPFVEVVDNNGAVAFAQIGATVLKLGIIVFTFMVKVAVVAQIPVLGVKVYVPEAVLLTVAGFQIPVIPLLEVVGKLGAAAP